MCSLFWGAAESSLAGVLIPESDSKVSPEQSYGVIHLSHRKRVISQMRWGFGARDKAPVINAWAEGMLQADLLERHVRSQRCLIPVRGYYEWSKDRSPHLVQLGEENTFALAGVWREFVGQKQFVVVTTRPNSLIKPIHDRMPCIVAEEDFGLWLEGDCGEAIGKVCIPFATETMKLVAVTKALDPIPVEVVQISLF